MLGGLASILLPCIASGYALSSMKAVLHYMPETIGRNTYFRILLVGFAWVSLWLGVAAFVDWRFLGNSYPGELWERWLAFFGDGQEGGSQIIHWKVLLTGILATLLAVVLHGLESLVFLIISRRNGAFAHRFLTTILERHARHMDAFLWEALGSSRLAVISLSNDKIYIGWVASMELTKTAPEWVHIVAVMSGYRCRDTREPVITTSYPDSEPFDPAASISPSEMLNMKMALPAREISSMQPFGMYRQEIQPDART